ncbi:MAG: hypothetical protein HS126_31445 [Anaerolineales bacterium]|nr:hypothetical protein [Anaerolineales bacterium]
MEHSDLHGLNKSYLILALGASARGVYYTPNGLPLPRQIALDRTRHSTLPIAANSG